jgi:hypothetical protein
MSTATTNATPNAQRPGPFSTFCAGQIATKSKRFKSTVGTDYFVTILKVPSRDAYSSPGSVNIRSSAPLGNPGDEWSGCPNPETGEIRPALVVADMYILAAD